MKFDKFIMMLFYAMVSVSCVIMAGTIYILFKFNHIWWFGDFDKSYVGILGDFIGGVVGTLFSIATTVLVYQTYQTQKNDVRETKRLTERQMNLGIKPDLYLLDTQVYGFSTMSEDGSAYALNFSQEKEYQDGFKHLYTKLVNIGVGVAKKIEYRWEFNVNLILDYIQNNFPEHTLVDIERERNGNVITPHIKGINSQTTYGLAVYMVPQTIDILVTSKNRDEATDIPYPIPYVILYTLAFKYAMELKREDLMDRRELLHNFPKCILHVSYQDIANNQHQKRFDCKHLSNGLLWSWVKVDNAEITSFTLQPNEF